MATFLLQDEGGRKYKVTAPDEQSAVAAFKKMQAQPTPDYGSPALNSAYNAIETIMSPMESYARRASDAMALNKMDEMLAVPGAAYDAAAGGQSFGDAYTNRLTGMEIKDQQLKDKNPKSALAGDITGVLAGPATKAGADWVGKGATWLDRSLRAAPVAGAQGLVSGFEGPTLSERAKNAAFTAVASGIIAPVAQAGGEFAGSQLSKAFNWVRGQGKTALPSVVAGSIDDPVTASVMKQPGSQQVSRADMDSAARELWRRLEADGRDPTKVFQAIQSGQMDERTLASIGGENVKQMVDTAASMPGRAKEIVAGSRLAAEQGQAGVVTDAAKKALNVSDDFVTAGQAVESQMKAAGPLYDDAFANAKPVDTAPVISKIDAEIAKSKGSVKTALQKSRELLLDNNGNIDVTLEGLHASKVALDDLYQAIKKDSSVGNIGRSKVLNVIHDLLDAMDTSNPGYATARDTFAGPAAVEDAMDIGRNIYKEDWIGTSADIAKMTASEKQGVRVGVVQATEDLADNVSNKADLAQKLTAYGKYLNRIKATFPSQQAFDQFKQTLFGQSREFQAVQMAGKGSQSAPRLADASMDLENLMGTAVDTARSSGGGDLTMIMRGVKALMGRMGAASEGQRAAGAALALTPGKTALPYMSAVMNGVDPSALGLMLMSGSRLPAQSMKEYRPF
jgi:hypothetical protein